MWDFQLRQISLPRQFENSIIAKILKKQEIQKAKNRQSVAVKTAEKERELSLAQVDADLVRAQAIQKGDISIAKQDADGQALLVQTYGRSIAKQDADGQALLVQTYGKSIAKQDADGQALLVQTYGKYEDVKEIIPERVTLRAKPLAP